MSSEALEERKLLTAAAIIAENALPGTSSEVWDIDGAGSANIQGFAAQFSVNHGERVDFKIDTDADDYRIDIYRMGWYDGDGARKITTIQPNASLANDQPNPVTDFNTGLVDAGNWRVSASWNVPQAAVSGVYIAKLVREDGTFGESHIIFVVRDDEGHSDMLFQTSDTTWQAYNKWGGGSLYENSFLSMGRSYEVSYNRPFDTRDNVPANFFFGAEYAMVRFLESNGYDVSYSSGIDTDRRGSELLEHQIFLSVGHDEYWSGQQRDNVEIARDAGVDLAFFSGNEVFWKTRWEDSIAGPTTPYTTLVSYKSTHDNAMTDPSGIWTGTWRDPRFSPPADGGRPENSLTGQLFTVNGDGSIGVSMNVGAADGDLRFWRNTSVANLTGNQTASLGDYVIGYESDEDIDNGFRPAGLFRLSSTTRNVNAYIQDYGSTYAKGTATHTMTLYRAASGALVFGAGTIQYSWGLDDYHDGPSTSNDQDMQQATINLFADMGVQPGSLRPGLVAAAMSTDFTRPTSTITSPANGVALTAGVAVTIRGTAQDQGGGRIAGVEVSVDGGTTWHMADGRESWTYTWTPRSSGQANIRTRAIDDSGNLETALPGIVINPSQNPGVYQFWDASTTPGTVDSGDGQAVELGVRFRVDANGFITGVRFYKSSANTGTHVAHLWTNTGTLLASATFTSETGSGWQQVNFDAPVAVTAGSTYVASYTAPNGRYSVNRNYFSTSGVDNGPLHAVPQGPSGPNGVYNYSPGSFPTLSYQSTNYWVDVVLNTAMAGDTTAPTISRFGQAGGASVITAASAFTITFGEAMNASTINTSTISLVRPDASKLPSGCCTTAGGWCSGCPLLNAVNNTPITATVSYDTATRTATVTPNSPLVSSTIYTLIVSAGGVKDLAGNALAIDTWTSFYTSNQPAPVLSSLWSTSTTPNIVDSGDGQAVELGLKFTASVAGQVTGARFYKSSANTGTHTATLWTSGGQTLATATFTSETGSGWQTVNFATPVSINAGTTYVISYHTNNGHYSVSRNALGSAFSNGSLSALANGGVYAYGANSAFPTQSYQSSNYFVDVVFSTTPTTDTLAPSITNFTPFGGTTNVPVSPTVTVNFSEALDPATVTSTTVKLIDGGNNAAPATLSYDANTRTATLTPTSPLANNMTYTIFVLGGSAGIRDLAGNTMAQNITSQFTTVAGATPDTTPPLVSAFNPENNGVFTGANLVATVTFSEPVNAATVKPTTVYLLRQGVTQVATTLVYDAQTRTATLTPTAPLEANTSYTIMVLGGASGIRDLAGNALAQNAMAAFLNVGSPPVPGDTVAPTVTGATPTGSNVAVSTTATVTFSETMNESTITTANVFLRSSSNVVIPTTLSYNASTRTATLTPTTALVNSTSYTVVVRGGATGVKDVAGNALAADFTSSFTTAAVVTPPVQTTVTMWPSSATPATANSGDTKAVEVGVRFYSDVNGSITGLRFYKSSGNTGTHVAHLWTASGQLLATATFTGESGSGWQQVNFSSPVAITAGTTYVASYYAPRGRYSVNRNYFDSAFTSGPLHVPASGGVYAYGSGNFPSQSYQGSNYWVDVVMSTNVAPDTTAPTVTAFSPTGGSTNVATSSAVTVTFSEALNAATVTTSTVFLRNASNVVVPATVSYNATNNRVTITPTSALANSTTYTIVVKGGSSGVKDAAGNAVAADVTSSFTTAAVVNPPATPSSLFPTAVTPSTVDSGDKKAVELGVKFYSDVNGTITGIRFYKSSANTGTHTAHLWTASGQLLATATFTSESGSGWQTVNFATPIAITAGTTYVASYYTTKGRYSVDRNYFNSAYTNGPLHVPVNGGVYSYGSNGSFPTSSYQGSNYWIDVLFTPAGS
ncbi:MAG: DUF4082 domain-containing protein [Pirellulales bacterium]